MRVAVSFATGLLIAEVLYRLVARSYLRQILGAHDRVTGSAR